MPKVAKNRIPTLLWSGWSASDGPGSLYEYSALQNTYANRPPFGPMSKNQKTSGRYQVVVGPWTHGRGLDDTIQLEWYDTWLKGKHTGIATTKTPMHLGEMTGDTWVNASTVPLTNAYTPMYLGDGALTTSVAKSPGSANINWAPPDAAGTTLSFEAEPATRTRVIAGPIAATIYAKSSTRNLQLTATLSDVARDGQSIDLATGTVVGSLRAIDKKASWYDRRGLMVHPIQPFSADHFARVNTVNRYDITLTPTMYSVEPGHRLRLSLSTQPPANKCALSIETALGLPTPCLPTNKQKGDLAAGIYSIEWGKATPSSINLPLMKPSALPVASSGVTATSNNKVVPLDWG
jgi:predicted acyl esterase